MYSYEIQQLMEYRNYLLEVQEYLKAFDVSESTQIARLKYEPYNDHYECWTYDGYYWCFKVRKLK